MTTYTLTPDTLRISRNVAAMSQQQLADLISVERSTIAKLETGSRSISPEIRRRLELALGWDDPELHDVIASVQRWRDDL